MKSSEGANGRVCVCASACVHHSLMPYQHKDRCQCDPARPTDKAHEDLRQHKIKHACSVVERYIYTYYTLCKDTISPPLVLKGSDDSGVYTSVLRDTDKELVLVLPLHRGIMLYGNHLFCLCVICARFHCCNRHRVGKPLYHHFSVLKWHWQQSPK